MPLDPPVLPHPIFITNIQILPDILQSGKLMSRACSVSLGKYHRDGNASRRNAASIILHHCDTTVLQSIRYTKSIYSPDILNYGTKNPMLLDSTPSQWGSLTLTQMHRHCCRVWALPGPPTEMESTVKSTNFGRVTCLYTLTCLYFFFLPLVMKTLLPEQRNVTGRCSFTYGSFFLLWRWTLRAEFLLKTDSGYPKDRCLTITPFTFLFRKEKYVEEKNSESRSHPAPHHMYTHCTHIWIHICRDLVHLDSSGLQESRPNPWAHINLKHRDPMCSVCVCVRVHTHTPTHTPTRAKCTIMGIWHSALTQAHLKGKGFLHTNYFFSPRFYENCKSSSTIT